MRRQAIRVGILGFEGANTLDMVGPLEAFATTGRLDPAPANADSPPDVFSPAFLPDGRLSFPA